MSENKEKIEYLNGVEFGRVAGVKKAAVSHAIKRGDVYKEKGKGINPQHPLNLAYAEANKERRERNKNISLSQTVSKELSNPDVLDKFLNALEVIKNPQINRDTAAGISQPESQNKISGYNPEDVRAHFDIKKHKNNTEQAKAAKAQIELAKMMGELILKKDVEWWWGKIVGSLHTYIMPLDDRLSNDVAAICGVTDHKIVLEVRDAIGNEIVKALAQIKDIAEKASAILTT